MLGLFPVLMKRRRSAEGLRGAESEATVDEIIQFVSARALTNESGALNLSLRFPKPREQDIETRAGAGSVHEKRRAKCLRARKVPQK